MTTTQPGPEKMTHDDSDSESWDSSDENDDKGPPPMLNIEKSADLNSVKNAIQNAIDNPVTKERPKPFADFENRIGQENLSTLKQGFETIRNVKENSPKPQPVVEVDKEQYSSFKEKFENIEKLKAEEQEQEKKALNASLDIHSLRSEGVTKAKNIFNPMVHFFKAADESLSNNCSICQKIIYPIEKITASKRVFHKFCFCCSKCQKRLDLGTYCLYDSKIYCKFHALELVKPEAVEAYQKGEINDDDIEVEIDEKASLKSTDDLDNFTSLQSRKSEWSKSAAQEMGKMNKKVIENEAELFEQGRVKAHSTKFIEGEKRIDEDEDEVIEQQSMDHNIVKSSKKKEKVEIQVGAKSIKSKWESGTVERAQGEIEDRSQELDEIKKNVSVKERFKDKAESESGAYGERKSVYDEEAVDTSFSHAAKESFLKGTAFQDTKPVDRTVASEDIKFSDMGNVKERFEKRPLDDGKTTEKTVVVDVRCAELGGIKATFEQAGAKQTTDEVAEQAKKKEQIEKEFDEIKQARKQMKQARSSKKQVGTVGAAAEDTNTSKVQSEVKSGVVPNAAPATKTLEQSKWAKEHKNRPEPVNRKAESDDEESDDGDFEVGNLVNKFKDIEQGKADERKVAKVKRLITPPPEGSMPEARTILLKEKEVVPSVPADELAGIKVEAKNLKARFENAAAAVEKAQVDPSMAEEKKRQLEDEFRKLKGQC
uniref:LIM zinc-binding domain-containing protein n=1 Tax=Romanomermis culicivorax TaxID=13658 RepID=A0A915JV19_ROMCU